MYHGEKTVGLTVHYMSSKLDEGDILLQESLAIEPNESLDHLIRRSKQHAAHCLARVLRQIAGGRQAPIRVDPSLGTYFTFPTRDEIREFRRRGFRAL
jgi:methionyl-tRNA formyltransferase